MPNMQELYEEYVVKHADSYKSMKICDDYYQKIVEFASQVCARKLSETHHRTDNRSELKRFTTGLVGEAALEGLLGIKIIDWTIGESSFYHHPDIPGYNVGIKTVERNKFPIIFKKNTYPQIICIRSIQTPNAVFVCGLASTSVLNKYQSDDLIVDPYLRARGTKTGFYGFEHLIPINGIADLAEYRK